MADAVTDKNKKTLWQRHAGLIKLGITALVLTLIFQFISVEDIWAGIKRTSPLVWLGVLAGFLVGHTFAALKWRLLAASDIDFLTALRAHFSGLAANLALPGVAGGDVARAAVLSLKVKSKQTLIVGSVLDRLIDVGILLIMAAIGAALIGTAGQTGLWLQFAAGALIMIALAAYFAVPAIAKLATQKITSDSPSKAQKLVLDLTAYMAAHRGRLVICAALSLAIQTGFVGLNVILSQSMAGPSEFAMWLFAWPLAKLIATLPISIGGLGIREASLAAVFSAFGSGSPIIVAVGFVWQTILIATGLIGLAIQFIGKSRAASNAAPSPSTAQSAES